MKNKFFFYAGILIIIFILLSYFIKVGIDNGENYLVKSSLLGLIIFYNPFILALYILIAAILIKKGI